MAPWNNILARGGGVLRAINPKLLLASVGLNIGTVSESFGGPGSSFHEKTISNYRSYNLKEAQKLVSGKVGASRLHLYAVHDREPCRSHGRSRELPTNWTRRA